MFGSMWGPIKVSNCYNMGETIINYPEIEEFKEISYFGEITGVLLKEATIENCYSHSRKTINTIDSGYYVIAQNIGIIDYDGENDKETKTLTWYINKNDSNPSVGENSEYITQNVQEVETYQSQEFCDMLNNWVNSNNTDGKYSTWKYDSNKNGGCPYLESLEGTIE